MLDSALCINDRAFAVGIQRLAEHVRHEKGRQQGIRHPDGFQRAVEDASGTSELNLLDMQIVQ